jgi:hypothetical protein
VFFYQEKIDQASGNALFRSSLALEKAPRLVGAVV